MKVVPPQLARRVTVDLAALEPPPGFSAAPGPPSMPSIGQLGRPEPLLSEQADGLTQAAILARVLLSDHPRNLRQSLLAKWTGHEPAEPSYLPERIPPVLPQENSRLEDPDGRWELVSWVTKGRGAGAATHSFGVLTLSQSQVVLFTLHLARRDLRAAERCAQELIGRVQASCAPVSQSVVRTLQASLSVSAGLAVVGSLKRFDDAAWGTGMALAGVGLYTVVCAAAMVWAARGAPQRCRLAQVRERMRHFVATLTVTLATILLASGMELRFAGLNLLFYLAGAVGGLALVLGMEFRFLRAFLGLLRRREPELGSAGKWSGVDRASLPSHFSVAEGQVHLAYQLPGQDSWAAICEVADWGQASPRRWQEVVWEWTTEFGKVTGRSYRTWDRHVETIAEARLGNRVIRVETPHDPEVALSYLPDLFPHAFKPQEKRNSLHRFSGTMSFSHLPALVLAISVLYVVAFAITVSKLHYPGGRLLLQSVVWFSWLLPAWNMLLVIAYHRWRSLFTAQDSFARRRNVLAASFGAGLLAAFPAFGLYVVGRAPNPLIMLAASLALALYGLIISMWENHKAKDR